MDTSAPPRTEPLGPQLRGPLLRSPALQMAVLGAVVFAGNFARTAIGPVQESLRLDLSLSDNQVALLQGPAMAIPVVLAAVPLGLLLDRYCRVRLVSVFAMLFLGGHLLTALASSFPLLLAARCLIGLTATATLTAAFSLLADLYPPERRGRISMLMSISQMLGNSSAFATGGWLLAAYDSSLDGWRWTLAWLSVPIAVALCSLLMVREPPRTAVPASQSTLRQVAAALACCRSVAPLLCGMLMLEMIFGALYVWGAPALARTFHLTSARVGSIMAVALIIAGFLGPVVGGMIADYCQRSAGPSRTLSAVGVLTLLGVPAALFAYVSSAELAGGLLIVFMAVISAAIVMGTAIFTVVIPSELRGICIAILFAAATLFGLGIAPVGVSLLSNLLGGEPLLGKALSAFVATVALLSAGAFALAGLRTQTAATCIAVPSPGARAD